MGRLRDALRWLYRRSSWTGTSGLGHRLWEHTQYVGAATAVALVAGTAIGLAVGRRRKPVVRLLWGLARTLPMLGAVAVLGTSGHGTTWLLLVALGLLVAPTVAGATAAGARSVPVEAVVAAHGLGFDRAERWRGVVLPLTLPHALAGLRAAVVQVVVLVTFAGYVGRIGGLGRLVAASTGAVVDDERVLGGIVATLVYATVVGAVVTLVRRFATSAGVRRRM
jgi:osmoprotectant transport system permease protein